MPVLRYWDPTLNQFVSLSGMGPQGPPAAASSPLAYVKYGPATLAGLTFPTALGSLDGGANLTIRFTAPASGSVIAKAAIYLRSIQSSNTAGENIPLMCFVTHGTSTQCSPQQRMIDLQLGTPGGNFVGGTVFYEQLVSGLTPGQVYQWDLAGYYYVTAGTGGATAYADAGSGNYPCGPAVLSIYDSAGVGAQGPQGSQGVQGAQGSSGTVVISTTAFAPPQLSNNRVLAITTPSAGWYRVSGSVKIASASVTGVSFTMATGGYSYPFCCTGSTAGGTGAGILVLYVATLQANNVYYVFPQTIYQASSGLSIYVNCDVGSTTGITFDAMCEKVG